MTLSGFDIRPIEPNDALLIEAARAYTSAKTYYRRFHTAKSRFSQKELRYLTEIDGRDHVALVAIERESGQLAGIARCIRFPDQVDIAEVALTVHDPFQRRGLGRELIERLAALARERGISQLVAYVQADNLPMRALLHDTFTECRIGEREANICTFTLSLQPTATYLLSGLSGASR
jgi:GNAT superfamily N-acetyltransferase